jgi:hypothetical protein
VGVCSGLVRYLEEPPDVLLRLFRLLVADEITGALALDAETGGSSCVARRVRRVVVLR